MKKIVVGGICLVFLIGAVIAGVFYFKNKTSKDYNFATSNVGTQAQNAYRNGDIDQAISLAEKALTENPNDIQVLEFLASAYAQKGSVEFKEDEYGVKAENIANRIIALNPSNVEALRTLGYSYEIRSDFEKAIEYYTKALSIDSKNAAVLSDKAHAEWLSGDTKNAVLDYESALSIAPNLVHALLGLSRIELGQGKYEDLRVLLNKALVQSDITNRQKSTAEQIIGASYLNELKAVEAVEHFDKALTFDENLESAWFGKGRAHILLLGSTKNGDEFRSMLDSVTSELQHAIGINPNYSRAFIALGDVFTVLKDPNAKKFYEEAKRVMPKDNTLTVEEKTLLLKSISL